MCVQFHYNSNHICLSTPHFKCFQTLPSSHCLLCQYLLVDSAIIFFLDCCTDALAGLVGSALVPVQYSLTRIYSDMSFLVQSTPVFAKLFRVNINILGTFNVFLDLPLSYSDLMSLQQPKRSFFCIVNIFGTLHIKVFAVAKCSILCVDGFFPNQPQLAPYFLQALSDFRST